MASIFWLEETPTPLFKEQQMSENLFGQGREEKR